MRRARHYPLPTEKILEAEGLHAAELRMLVANYYQAQEMRKRADMQLRHLGAKPELWISTYLPESFADIEQQIVNAFEKILTAPIRPGMPEPKLPRPIVGWMLAQRGVGHIIAAGLLAHIDISKAPTVGHIWRFAGLDPTLKWEKGQKRPFNAELKQICWKLGECFLKQSNDPDCFYGKLYRQKKQEYIARNEAGGFAEKAAIYKGVTDKGNKKLLSEGKVPPAYIDACARRFAVKIFLSHLHAVWHWHEFKRHAPTPYALQLESHAHIIEVPHGHLVPGFVESKEPPQAEAAE